MLKTATIPTKTILDLEPHVNYDVNNSLHESKEPSTIITSLTELFALIELSEVNQSIIYKSLQATQKTDAMHKFKMRVPLSYAKKITKNNIHDPLLLQVLPSVTENITHPSFIDDPLAEKNTSAGTGLIHKYKTRVLLTTTSACAIHCRYCFRKNYDYQSNRLTKQNLIEINTYITNHPEVNEVILSGGDPLSLTNTRLFELLDKLESIPQIKTIRLHSRQAIAMPERFDKELIQRLVSSSCHIVLVTHANHAQEIGEAEKKLFSQLNQTKITLLNQSVLLKGINDNVNALTELSYALFNAGILPYYLHLLDKVTGTTHFYISSQKALSLYKDVLANLPGYLVPTLAYEDPHEPSKVPVSPYTLNNR